MSISSLLNIMAGVMAEEERTMIAMNVKAQLLADIKQMSSRVGKIMCSGIMDNLEQEHFSEKDMSRAMGYIVAAEFILVPKAPIAKGLYDELKDLGVELKNPLMSDEEFLKSKENDGPCNCPLCTFMKDSGLGTQLSDSEQNEEIKKQCSDEPPTFIHQSPSTTQ